MTCRPAHFAVTLAALVASVLALLVAQALAPIPAQAVEVEFSGGTVKRDVLALYDSRHEAHPAQTRLHQFVEMPLNWLGLKLTYVDVNGDLPSDFGRYRGIVSWFIEPLAIADRYLDWLDRATASGLRLAVFAHAAPGSTRQAEALSARVHARLGLQVADEYVTVTHRARFVVNDPAVIGFERPIDKVLPDFQVVRQIAPQIAVHLAAEAPGQSTPGPFVLVATGPAGGYASDNYTISFEASTDKVRWTINPFEFLRLTLARERIPVPDVTTLSGRRVYFSHIDGDGWNNISTIDGYRQAGTFSAEVVRREAIEAFPDLPVTVGVIAGDLIPELGGSTVGREIARRIYALPQVEVGSHSYTHPFDWGFFENYSRAREEALIDKIAEPALPATQKARRFLYSIIGQQVPRDLRTTYTAGSSDLPRTYLRHPFDLSLEISGALGFSESLAPPGKRARLYQWSGNCLPFEGAIAETRKFGARNMNGGDTRLDSDYPSVFYVPPLSKPVGTERQIYAVNSNENTYTNDWTGPYYGFALLGETVRNTENPRRLKPFNLYYHMYSGEKESALAALLQNLRLARSLPLTPIAASRYAAMAEDFFGVEIVQVDLQAWIIASRGEVQTVRFDAADGLEVDTAKSVGVLGSSRHPGGAMYVALDPAVPTATLTLRHEKSVSATPDAIQAAATAEQPPDAMPVQLISSRWLIRGLKREACGFSFAAEGFGASEMILQTIPGKAFGIIAESGGREVARTAATSDANGILEANLAVDATNSLELKFVCRE